MQAAHHIGCWSLGTSYPTETINVEVKVTLNWSFTNLWQWASITRQELRLTGTFFDFSKPDIKVKQPRTAEFVWGYSEEDNPRPENSNINYRWYQKSYNIIIL